MSVFRRQTAFQTWQADFIVVTARDSVAALRKEALELAGKRVPLAESLSEAQDRPRAIDPRIGRDRLFLVGRGVSAAPPAGPSLRPPRRAPVAAARMGGLSIVVMQCTPSAAGAAPPTVKSLAGRLRYAVIAYHQSVKCMACPALRAVTLGPQRRARSSRA